MRKTSYKFLLLAFQLLIISHSLWAATFTVNSTDDAVDSTLGDGSCSSAGGICTLRAAVQEANALAGADTISIPAGTYLINIAGSSEEAAATGDIDIISDLTITGAGRDSTFIDGMQLDRIFHIDAPATAVSISALTVRNGFNNSTGSGGGIRLESDVAVLNLSACRVSGNSADSSGGGVANVSDGTLNITDCEISGNETSSAGGGIVHTGSGTVTVTDSQLSNNYASGFGGGIQNDQGGTLTVTNTVLAENFSRANGGGICNSSTGTTTITNSTLENNVAGASGGAGRGGGVINNAGGTLTISNTMITGNFTYQDGGGIENNAAGTVTVTNTTVAGNQAHQDGGGVHNNSSGSVTLTNVTVSGNFSLEDGGGLSNEGSGSLTIRHGTVVGNYAAPATISGVGSGVDNSAGAGTLTIENTILAFNIINDCGTSTITRVGNNITQQSGCTTSGPGQIFNADPELGILADNGGPVYTHAIISSGSPIVDNSLGSTSTADARGFARPVDGDLNGTSTADIGAYEFGIDCNANLVDDATDIESGQSTDCDANGVPDACQEDSDNDSTIDSCEECDSDANKTLPGVCGCGIQEVDQNANGITDCDVTAELALKVDSAKKRLKKLKATTSAKKIAELKSLMSMIVSDATANVGSLKLTDPTVDPIKLTKAARGKTNKAIKNIGSALFDASKKSATSAVTKLRTALDA